MSLLFVLDKQGVGWDITDIVQTATWSGRKNSPARSLQLKVLDDPDLGESNRPDVNVYAGQKLIMSEDGTELFRGIVMKQVRSQDRTLLITAYDNGIYLANNKGTFKYSNKTLTEIFRLVCQTYGITRGQTANVSYKIKSLVKPNTTIYDILCNALSKTYKATGERFFIISKKGQLNLIRRKEHVSKLVLETGSEDSSYGNLTQYSYSKDISGTRTRLLLVSSNGQTTASWTDRSLEKILGIMQDVQTPDNTLPTAKLKTEVINMLKELEKPVESLNVTALGVSSVYTGGAIYVSIPEIGIKRTYYVDADTHTWDGGMHTMKLTLNWATDIETLSEEGNKEVWTGADKSATATAKQQIADAKTALKEKKTAEKIVTTAATKAEQAANKAETALNAAKKQKQQADKNHEAAMKQKTEKQKEAKLKAEQKCLQNADKQAKIVKTQAAIAVAKYDEAVKALAEANEFMLIAQEVVTQKTEYAMQKADASKRRAVAASDEAEQYIIN